MTPIDQFAQFPFNPTQPGAYSATDASALAAANGDSAPVVAVLGDAAGGQPNTALWFSNAQTAKQVLRSGVLLDSVRAAFAGGARRVCAVRVGNGITPGTLALAGASGTVVTLTARGWGAWTNSIKVTVAANNKVTVAYTDPTSGATYTETFNAGAGATVAQLASLINGTLPGGGQPSAFVTAAAGGGTMPAATLAQTPLASGADTGAIVSGDWTTGLAALETQDVDFVEVATGDATVHAQVLAHCNALSAPGARHERVTVVGAVSGENVAAQVTRATGLRDKRAQLVYPGVWLYDVNGTLTLYPPYVAAALVAGMHTALPDQATSLTHADVEVIDVEARLSSIQGGDIDTLLAANVSPIAPKRGGGFWLVDSLSGYQADAQFRDFHKARTADTVSKRLRERLEDKFIGGKTLNRTADTIRVETLAELRDQFTEELIRDYDAAGVRVAESPTDPKTFAVTAPVMLPDTTKFILITVALQPASTK